MKKFKMLSIAAAFFMVFNAVGNIFYPAIVHADTGQTVINFPDANFEKAVRQIINKPTGDIYKSDVENVTVLAAGSSQISSIEGIENFTNLQTLILTDNSIKDLTPLDSLANITYLSAESNNLSDISFLNNFASDGVIKYIDIYKNNISDITPLQNCSANLMSINIGWNNISDISALGKLPKLKEINMSFNGIKDLSILSNLPDIYWLLANDNYITDLSPLASLPKLQTLDLNHNPIENLEPVKNLTNLSDFRALSLYNLSPSDSKYQTLIDKATSIIKKIIKPDMTDLEKILAVNDYMVKNTFDSQENENYYNAYGTLVEGKGVCSGYTEGTLLLLDLVGIKSYYTQGRTQGSGHAWNVVRLNGKLYNLDTLWNDGTNSYNYFMVSNNELLKQDTSRSLNPDTYRDCSDEKYAALRKILNAHDNSTNNLDYAVKGQYIFYSNTEDGNKLYRTDIESDAAMKLSDDMAKNVKSDGTWVYYINAADNNPYKIGIDGTNRQVQDYLLKSMTVDSGYLTPGFDPIVADYNLELQYGSTTVPNIQVETLSSNYTAEVVKPDTLPGKVVINIKDLNNQVITSYNIMITVADTYDPGLNKVTFGDKALERIVRQAAGLTQTGDIYQMDISGVKELSIVGQITSGDLSGLDSVTGLESLTLIVDNVQDITPLAQLKNLESLNISSNKVTDISALEGLTKLTILNLNYNQISDLSPLKNLTNLKHLQISGNKIQDLSTLSTLVNLQSISADGNQISDISPISGLKNLDTLFIRNNNITDISALGGMTSLGHLFISNNKISDISSLSNLKGLVVLLMSNNNISDISALTNLKYIYWLELSGNNINDLSSLYGFKGGIRMKDFTFEDLNGDNKVDITDLAELSRQYGYKKASNKDFSPKYDMNSDGNIDIYDLVSVSKAITN